MSASSAVLPAVPPLDPACFALLDDCHATCASPSSRLYRGLVRVHGCADPAALGAMWAEVDADLRAGLHAVVLADYEWGVRLNGVGCEGVGREGGAPVAGGSLRVLMFSALQHLSAVAVEAWLAAAEAGEGESFEAARLDAAPAVGAGAVGSGAIAAPAPAGVLGLRASVDHAAFEDAIARIHAAIAEGETYQVNYSYRLDFDTFGSPLALYRRLRARQPVAFGALIRLPADADEGGPDWVLSCSPELFLRHHDGVLQARPMKGTAARSGDDAVDALAARRLAADAKNRAENLMIVDLLRNDLGRVATTGSVRVPALFEVERYPTVLQMTSTVAAALPDATAFPALLRALFPCGSITGAPKHRTMQLIAELETEPRGLYTGSLGWIDAPRPGRACGDFCLSVAIRTLTLNRIGSASDQTGAAMTGLAGGDAAAPAAERTWASTLAGALHRGRMGVGAGIVIDSRAADEYAECRLKARFLSALDPGFALFETMYATREAGVRNLQRHLARLEASAAALDFAFPRAAIATEIARQLAALPPATPSRLRLALHQDGRIELAAAALDALPPGPVGVLLAARPLDDPQGLGAHKTTLRARYDEGIRAALAAGAFDMLFFDSSGRLTEGGRSNVFLLLDGEWRTPPAGRGVLPGTMRAALLEDPAWAAREAELSVDDLRRAQRIVLTNALRGAVEARLDDARRGGGAVAARAAAAAPTEPAGGRGVGRPT